MIPRTFLSTYAVSGQQQMVVVFLENITGLTRWVDYIPVKFAAGTKVNSYDNDGFILVDAITPSGTDVAFKEYIPVYNDTSATDAWTVNAVGYIPCAYEDSPFNQLGPTLDLVFAGIPTNPLGIATLTDNTLSLDFTENVYKIVVPYSAWATFAINYAVMPTALLTASININPEKTLFKDTLIGGRALGDINNSGTVSSTDSLAYIRFNNEFWLSTDAENEYIRTVLNPYMLANANLYAAYLLPG